MICFQSTHFESRFDALTCSFHYSQDELEARRGLNCQLII